MVKDCLETLYCMSHLEKVACSVSAACRNFKTMRIFSLKTQLYAVHIFLCSKNTGHFAIFLTMLKLSIERYKKKLKLNLHRARKYLKTFSIVRCFGELSHFNFMCFCSNSPPKNAISGKCWVFFQVCCMLMHGEVLPWYTVMHVTARWSEVRWGSRFP